MCIKMPCILRDKIESGGGGETPENCLPRVPSKTVNLYTVPGHLLPPRNVARYSPFLPVPSVPFFPPLITVISCALTMGKFDGAIDGSYSTVG